MNEYFKAVLSPKMTVITYVLCGIVLGLMEFASVKVVPISPLAGFGIVGAGFLIIFGTRAFVSNGFRITDDAVVVQRWIKSTSLPLADISEIHVTAPLEVLRGRLYWRFGDGGFWGAHGVFYNKNIGKFYVYMTDERNVIDIISRSGTHVFLSPSPKEAFVEKLKAALVKKSIEAKVV